MHPEEHNGQNLARLVKSRAGGGIERHAGDIEATIILRQQRISQRLTIILCALTVVAVAVAGALLFITQIAMEKTSPSFMSSWADAGGMMRVRDFYNLSFAHRMSLFNLSFQVANAFVGDPEGSAALHGTVAHLRSTPVDIMLQSGLTAPESTRGVDDDVTGTAAVVDGVWELPSKIGTFSEGAMGDVTLANAGSPSYVRERLRQRDYARLATADVPWESIYSDSTSYYPECVLDTHSCSCNGNLSNRNFCAEIAHRQKPVLRIASQVNREGDYDCPTVRCIVSSPKNYSGESILVNFKFSRVFAAA